MRGSQWTKTLKLASFFSDFICWKKEINVKSCQCSSTTPWRCGRTEVRLQGLVKSDSSRLAYWTKELMLSVICSVAKRKQRLFHSWGRVLFNNNPSRVSIVLPSVIRHSVLSDVPCVSSHRELIGWVTAKVWFLSRPHLLTSNNWEATATDVFTVQALAWPYSKWVVGGSEANIHY
jgi:hypothetical protein